MSKEIAGPAFPIAATEWHGSDSGMDLRDYLAAKAMQGYLSNAWQAKEMDETGDSSAEQMALVAEAAYCMADAMLKSRGE
ncbi:MULTISPECIES: hypothetical protein [unclassified Tatumella]|uniref:hypothetical protein n=1 Tax=unclassified Tatumella TaxID=2649542 RepID=UPI001BB047E5|nr:MULTISPECIES: hypothetical protein [unclassified Tatumella]MBS0857268.1 hypothetical protein [Tatumella sp. JGM16]MBS0914021.1 hypothetical protein [Tatumella sp. JGM91]